MQLMLAVGCWLSSPFALQCARSGLLPLNLLKNPLAASLPPESPHSQKLEEAIHQEAKNRAASLLDGVLRYCETPYKREVKEPPVIWRSGNTRVLDYGSLAPNPGELQSVVLFIPSLINRYYILDLEEDRSLLRHLVSQGVYPLVIDWGAPGEVEAGFDCGDYVSEILAPAIDFIARSVGGSITLAGYCMGGVLAMAAAKARREQVAALALFATPWDFHCKSFSPFLVDDMHKAQLAALIDSQPTLEADFVQSLFYVTDPFIFEQKFRRYSELQPDSRAARDFIALEHWVNDGVPMTAGVARDCLLGWAQDNILARGAWKIGKHTVSPKGLEDLPVFMAIPQNDHVVPQDCAMPLAQALPHARLIHPGAGHVGMMVGSRARRELWQPFADWVLQTAP